MLQGAANAFSAPAKKNGMPIFFDDQFRKHWYFIHEDDPELFFLLRN